MKFDEFEQFMRIHGGAWHKYKESGADNNVWDMMAGNSQFVEYRCDNVHLWCRARQS